MEVNSCTVVSIVPAPITQEMPGLFPPRYHIPASDGLTPRILVVHEAFHYVYLDADRGSLKVLDAAQQVASSIVNDFIGSQQGMNPDSAGQPGIFWVPGPFQPTEISTKFPAELTNAKKRQHIWLTQVSQMADNDWNRYRTHSVISDLQRKSARILGWVADEHEWMVPEINESPKPCPACGASNAPGLVVCPQCRCILRAEEYKKLQFA